MNLNVLSSVANKFGRPMLIIQKHSPTLMFGAGVVGVAATVVLACRATLKVDEVLEETQKKLNTAKELQHEDYSEQDRQKDLALIYVKTGAKLAKMYAPAVMVGVVSVGLLTGAHIVLNRRNAALTAAYAGLDRAWREYRDRVITAYGKDKDDEFRYGTVTREVTEHTEDGMKSKTINVYDPNGYSPYAKFFDELCPNWQRQPEYNMLFLKAQQNYANDLLKSRGHLFLNEVYDMLGLERTRAGAVVGWVISKNGDNFVDFGIFDGSKTAVRDFVNGWEPAILLDFNVDGVIYDKI